MKRTRALVASTCVAVLVMAGCSSGPSSTAVEVTEAPSGLPVQGRTLTYDPNRLVNDGEVISLDWWLWDGDEVFGAFAEAYSELHPNVEINVVNQPWDDYWTKLPLALRDGSGPALFNIHNSHHDNLIGYLEPYDLPLDELAADYLGVEAHVVDGELHYLDYGLMTGLVYYNADMWAEAGLTDEDVPVTWEEMREVAERLTVRDGDRFTQAGFSYNDLFREFSLGLPYQEGQHLFAADQVTPDLDNPVMLSVIERFLDLYDVHQVGSKDFGPDAEESFGQGQTAMVYSWGHFYGRLLQDYPEITVGTFRTPVPDADEPPYAYDRYNGESTTGINAGASPEEIAVAQDFVRFSLTHADLLRDLSLHYSVFPMYLPLADDPAIAAHPVLSALGDIERYIWPGPLPAAFETSIDVMWEDILYNGVDPATALAAAQDAVEREIAHDGFVSRESSYPGYPTGR